MWILLPWILQGFDIVHNEIVGFVQFGWEWQDQMFTIESEENVKDFVFLLSTRNTENCPSNCNNFPPFHHRRFPYGLCHHLSRPAYSLTYERDVKPLPQRLSYLPLPDHERLAPCASHHQIDVQFSR